MVIQGRNPGGPSETFLHHLGEGDVMKESADPQKPTISDPAPIMFLHSQPISHDHHHDITSLHRIRC